jgi:hypothetical protein
MKSILLAIYCRQRNQNAAGTRHNTKGWHYMLFSGISMQLDEFRMPLRCGLLNFG